MAVSPRETALPKSFEFFWVAGPRTPGQPASDSCSQEGASKVYSYAYGEAMTMNWTVLRILYGRGDEGSC